MDLRAWVGLVGITTSLLGQSADSRLAPAAPRVVEAGPDQLHWQHVTASTGEDGSKVLRTNSWTELATGLTYFDQAQRTWVPTEETFSVAADGSAIAARGPHRVVASPALNTWGAIEITDPQGQVFRSHLLGLAYTDPTTGRSVLIAEPKASIGALVAPNRVVWEDALDDIKASVRLIYCRAGAEHDVVLEEAPPPPSAFGLPDTAMLEVWHEIIEAPETVARASVARTNAPPEGVNLALAADESLTLGSMTMGQGRAFSLATEPDTAGLPALQGTGSRCGRAFRAWETAGS